MLCLAGCNGEVFAHFVEAFLADAFDGEQIVDAFEGAVGFAGVEDFLRGRGADAGDLFEFRGGGGVEVDGVSGRLLVGEGKEGKQKAHNDNRQTNPGGRARKRLPHAMMLIK